MRSERLQPVVPFGLPRPVGPIALILDAQGLHGLVRQFLLLCLINPPPDQSGALEKLRDLRLALSAIRTTVAGLRIAGADWAFTPDIDAALRAFDDHACLIITGREAEQVDDPAVLSFLTNLVSHDVTNAINTIVAQVCKLLGTSAGPSNEPLIDQLTGLPTRVALQNLVDGQAIATQSEGPVAVFKVEIDNIRRINVSNGIKVGDQALRHAAATLRRTALPDDQVFRRFGEEFVIVSYTAADYDALCSRVEDLIAALSAPFECEGELCALDVRIGISAGTVSEVGQLQSLLDDADLAARKVVASGLIQHRFYTPDLRVRHAQDEELRAQILVGMQFDQFAPYFQPQVEARSGKLVGLEALVRWHHPTRGTLGPPDFLAMAQKAGLLERLDIALVKKIFAIMGGWRKAALDVPRVSINLTAKRLGTNGLVDALLEGVAEAGLEPNLIGLEILESAMIDANSRQVLANIRNLTDAGFKMELDDFGTGHAAISNLRNFRVDRIKIDRSFVKNIHMSSELAKITTSMIALAHSLRVDALAEGVETVEERLVITALGADHIQGYGIAPPLPAQDVETWIRRTQYAPRLPGL